MRTVKWCLMFGVVLAGVVVGYCRPCHEDYAPLPPMLTSFEGECCEEGCDCCKHGRGTECESALPEPGYFRDGGNHFPSMAPDLPTSEALNALQAAEAEKAAKLVR